MRTGYFNPWRNAPDRECRSCRFSIGMRDGTHPSRVRAPPARHRLRLHLVGARAGNRLHAVTASGVALSRGLSRPDRPNQWPASVSTRITFPDAGSTVTSRNAAPKVEVPGDAVYR